MKVGFPRNNSAIYAAEDSDVSKNEKRAIEHVKTEGNADVFFFLISRML